MGGRRFLNVSTLCAAVTLIFGNIHLLLWQRYLCCTLVTIQTIRSATNLRYFWYTCSFVLRWELCILFISQSIHCTDQYVHGSVVNFTAHFHYYIFTTLPTHCLRRLLVEHWHLIEKSLLLSRLFPNRPTVAFRPTIALENSLPEQD